VYWPARRVGWPSTWRFYVNPLLQLYRFSPFIAFIAILALATYVVGINGVGPGPPSGTDHWQLARLEDVEALGRAHAQIPVGDPANGAGARLRSFSLISLEVAAALSHTSTYSMRLALGAVLVRLDDLVAELRDSPERYAGRFHPVALRWREIVAGRLDALARALEQDIANPYVVGVPLTAQDTIFVGRMQIAARLEQSLRARHSPPVLLYGQRRMGKSSLLLNLARLLPESIIPLYVDGQAIAGAAGYAEFLYHLAGQMAKSARGQRRLALPALTLESLAAGAFTAFSAWLDAVESVLERDCAVAVLALDEFEVLTRLLDRRINTADFTDLLRHLIQHRPRFKLVLAGSHTLEEFYPLAGALINLEVLKITYLTTDEARGLIQHPVKDFALAYTPAAVHTVLELTHGHPYLLQLLCYELIWLKNEQPAESRYLAEAGDIDEAAGRALATGATFFAALQTECSDAGALAVMRAVAAGAEAVRARRWRRAAGAEAALDGALSSCSSARTGAGGGRLPVPGGTGAALVRAVGATLAVAPAGQGQALPLLATDPASAYSYLHVRINHCTRTTRVRAADLHGAAPVRRACLAVGVPGAGGRGAARAGRATAADAHGGLGRPGAARVAQPLPPWRASSCSACRRRA
jgi:hypothetical protein